MLLGFVTSLFVCVRGRREVCVGVIIIIIIIIVRVPVGMPCDIPTLYSTYPVSCSPFRGRAIYMRLSWEG